MQGRGEKITIFHQYFVSSRKLRLDFKVFALALIAMTLSLALILALLLVILDSIEQGIGSNLCCVDYHKDQFLLRFSANSK